MFFNFNQANLFLFLRVYDRKCAVLGLSSVLTTNISQWPLLNNVAAMKSIIMSCLQLLQANDDQRNKKGLFPPMYTLMIKITYKYSIS